MAALRAYLERRAIRRRVRELRREIDLVTRVSSVVDESLKTEVVLGLLKEIKRLESSSELVVEAHHELTLE